MIALHVLIVFQDLVILAHHWVNFRAFLRLTDCPAVLGGEQRESNGCAALAGPYHELCSRRGAKANQQVTNARELL